MIASDHTPTIKLGDRTCHINKSLDEACDDHMQKNFLVAKPEWASLCFYCKDLWTYNRLVRTGNNWVILPIVDNIDRTIFSKTLSQCFDNVLSILANHYQWQKKMLFQLIFTKYDKQSWSGLHWQIFGSYWQLLQGFPSSIKGCTSQNKNQKSEITGKIYWFAGTSSPRKSFFRTSKFSL